MIGSLAESFDKIGFLFSFDPLTCAGCIQSVLIMVYSWIGNLPHYFERENLKVVENNRYPARNDLMKAMTECSLLVYREAMTKNRDLYFKAIEETQKGVAIEVDFVVVVGMKELGED